MWLIGQRCKCGDTLSWLILIGRGLDLKKQKEEKWVRWTRFFALLSWQSKRKYPVMMAKRIHPFPFRTRKLSSSALMVLGGRLPGRVGRCRNKSSLFYTTSFFHLPIKIVSQDIVFFCLVWYTIYKFSKFLIQSWHEPSRKNVNIHKKRRKIWKSTRI